MDLTDILLGDQLFKNCSKEQVKAFLSRTFYRLRRRPYDCYVAYMGDACNDIIMLVEGTVYTSMVSDKKEVVIETIQAPSMLAPAFIYGEKKFIPCQCHYQNELHFFIHKQGSLFAAFEQ